MLYTARTQSQGSKKVFEKSAFIRFDTYGEAIREYALPFAKRVEDRRDSGRLHLRLMIFRTKVQ
ncbi:MAG: hypothetical protein WCE94_13740 [Candidatus Methanoperedens sp.]